MRDVLEELRGHLLGWHLVVDQARGALQAGQALGAARVSGTPAWERTVVADSADFAFASASLAWLPALFRTGRDMRRTLWGNLAFALAYNLVLVSFALRGASHRPARRRSVPPHTSSLWRVHTP